MLQISSKLLSGLKMSASKILCSMKIGELSISLPSMLTFDFCEDMKSSRWYACCWWRLSQSWRLFEMQGCATISLPYCLYNDSTSHIIRFGLCTTAKLYPRSSFDQRCIMEILPSYSIICFTAEQPQSQQNKHPHRNRRFWPITPWYRNW